MSVWKERFSRTVICQSVTVKDTLVFFDTESMVICNIMTIALEKIYQKCVGLYLIRKVTLNSGVSSVLCFFLQFLVQAVVLLSF